MISNFGLKLKELRISHGLSQQELAQKLNCHKNVISNYELGKRIPNGDTLADIARVVGVSVDYLLGLEKPKMLPILTIAQQVQSYIDAGMVITSLADVEKALKSVGFYRLHGYSFHLYDNATKKYVPGTKFEDILKLYQFDQELSALIFSMISKIEVALRVRLVEALLIHGEPLVLQDSSIFKEKKLYWQNMSTVS